MIRVRGRRHSRALNVLAVAAVLVGLIGSACTADSSGTTDRAEPISVSFGEMPSVTAAHGDFIYAADRRGNAIAKIDPTANEVILRRDLGDSLQGDASTIWDLDAAGDFLWATIPHAKTVLQLDPESLALERELRVGDHVSDLYAAGGMLWFSTESAKGVDLGRIDAGSGDLLEPLPFGPENTHIADVVEFDGSIWAITDHARYIDSDGPNATFEVSAELWQIEPSGGEVLDKLSLGSTFARGAVDPLIGDVEVGAEGLWMSRVHERRLVLVDPTDTELLMQFNVAIFEYPWEFEVLDGDLWIGELNERRVAHIDTQTRERTLFTLEGQTSFIGGGFDSIWVPTSGRPPDGGTVVRLDENLLN